MKTRAGLGLAAVIAVGAFAPGSFGVGCGGQTAPSAESDSGAPDGGVDDTGPPVCGNHVVEGVEECDDGNTVNGDGCNNDCTFPCKPGDPYRGDNVCDDKNACDGVETCLANHTCSKGTVAADGTSCGTSKICKAGKCLDAVCGDGVVTGAEECDDGNTTNGDGCDSSCKFSCVSSDKTRDCTPSDPCKGKSTCDDGKHVCSPATPLADGTSCATGKICKSGVCTSTLCGNGSIDAGEECDPPDGKTCDATCHKIVPAVCGDGKRETGEQCDDGGTANLDGCSATCTFEQDQRANAVRMVYDTSFCSANALGGAIGSPAQSQIKTALDNGVKNGSTTLMFEFLSLADLSGTSSPSLTLGGLTGRPASAPPGVTYDGTSDLDWWYTTDSSVLDSTRTPTAQLPGAISAKHLSVGPGTLNIVLTLSGTPTPIKVTQTTINADIGATSAPKSSSGAPPGHLASENVDPALVSFAAMSNGEMCGNITARSLANVPAPAAIVSGGAVNCSEGYSASNSMLDVIVGGCHVLLFISAVRSTQPDAIDAAATSPGGSGSGYKFTADSTHTVTGCVDGKGASVSFSACLDALAYSSAFAFSTDRVIAK